MKMTKEQKQELEELKNELGFEIPIDKDFTELAEKPMIDLVELSNRMNVPKDKSIKQTIIDRHGNEMLEKLKPYIFVRPEKY